MGVSDDYFLLYHGIDFKQNNCFLDLKVKSKDDFLELASIFLTINRKNYNKFLSVPIFNNLVKKYFKDTTNSLEEVYEYQYNILEKLLSKSSNFSVDKIKDYFLYLKEYNIITSQEWHKLSNILKIINYQINMRSTDKYAKKDDNFSQIDFFHKKKQVISKIINELKKTINKNNLKNIEQIENYINTQKFSIGITGVMNAGKSTMLNALLGKEILGTSVIPETANLTIVRYSKIEKATVRFWNKKEWNQIEEDAKDKTSIDLFVKNTKKYFKDKIKNYILERSRLDKVSVNELSKYSSASHNSKLCNLVKYIELYTNLEFLKDGVEIVDTPGLDDPVIQREEITKSYLGKCDMLIHLMNVNQVATATDIEFIINTLLYHNITKMIIILTRVDTVDSNELEEALKYTKESIKKTLHTINKESKINNILSRLEFIPVSAKNAMICKADKLKAKDLGLILEETGITKVENSLKELLFGKNNQKNRLFVDSIFLQIKSIIINEIQTNELEIKMLSKSKDEIEKLYDDFQDLKSTKEALFDNIQRDINIEIHEINEYIKALEQFVNTKIEKLIEILTSRVIDDVRYELRKNKTLPKEERIIYIIQNGKKDGMIDLLRDYNYQISKKVIEVKNKILQIYKDNSFDINPQNNTISGNNSFIDKIVLKNDTIFLEHCINTIKKTKLKTIDTLQSNLLQYFKEYFEKIDEELTKTLKELSLIQVETLKKDLKIPLQNMIKNERDYEEILQERLNNSLLDENEKNIKIENRYKKLETLRNLLNRIEIENS